MHGGRTTKQQKKLTLAPDILTPASLAILRRRVCEVGSDMSSFGVRLSSGVITPMNFSALFTPSCEQSSNTKNCFRPTHSSEIDHRNSYRNAKLFTCEPTFGKISLRYRHCRLTKSRVAVCGTDYGDDCSETRTIEPHEKAKHQAH